MTRLPRARPTMLRQAGPLLILLLVALLPSASAHAVLQSADPAPNARAPVGLAVVEYTFTEDVERDYTSADVFDSEGNSVAAGPVEFDEARHNVIRLPVQPLADGVYEATWRALSVDTHTTRGTFIFAVGNATLYALDPTVEEHDSATVARDGFARFAFYAGLFLALGIPVFALYVLRERAPPSALFGTAAAFGLVGAAAAGVGLLFLSQRTELSFSAAAASVAGRTFVWRGLLLAGATLACTLAALRPASWRGAAIAAAALAAGSALATSLGSHAASVRDNTALFVAADAVHLLMAGLWVGGVVGFLHVGWGRPAGEFARMILRFSPLAVASVVAVLATGALAAFQHMPCWGEGPRACLASLRTESYVRLVAVKLALMLPLIAMGAYHRYRVAPMLEDASARSTTSFRRVVQVEALVMGIVLLAAGTLAASAPPAEDAEQAPRSAQVLELQNFTRTSHVILMVSPNPVTVGVQKLVVAVHPLDGALENSTRVAIKVYGADEREPEVTTQLEKVTPNEWERSDSFFTREGEWKVTVLVQRPNEFSRLTFNVTVVR